MTTSSQQTICSTTSSDTITISSIDLSKLTTYDFSALSTSYNTATTCIPTITLTNTGSCYSPSPSTFTISSGSSCPTVIGGGFNTISNIWGGNDQAFLTQFPDWSRVQEMCEIYPGLKIAFEKFKTTYHLVKEDFDNPENKHKGS